MKKHRWFAGLAVMVMALAVVGCSNPSSGNEFPLDSSGGSGNSSGTGNSGVDYRTCQVGDFILKDGTILSKDKTPKKNSVAAVIVRAADDRPDGRPALGVGIVHNKMAWCTKNAAGYNKDITALHGNLSSGYMFGSDGWDILKRACSDAEDNPEEYPAWNYSLTYAETNGLSGDLATGWYLPTLVELFTIYQNKTAVDASLLKAGGSTFGTSNYWSCCQRPASDCSGDSYFAQVMEFNVGSHGGIDKASDYCYVCSVRAFN